ncbi:Imm63 family immunity protein [Aquisediminimonas profunda]|uniref:Imm63 family immunity protein n=1 Tax=Aquisediminimonas profunda TaxID=1550733 RepID=UPI001C637020|nr:Imm63 family immunity protein [Aquisediminimonas profunda]
MQSGNLVSLATLRARIKQLADKIDAPPSYLPAFENSRQDGSHHVEIDRQYHWVVCERGSEFQRRSTSDVDELLFWVFSSITFSMAVDFEFAHRRSGEDARRQLFSKQEEFLGKLFQSWADREAQDHQVILQRNPFRDN